MTLRRTSTLVARLSLFGCVGLGLFALTRPAKADGFALNRYEPSGPGAGFLNADQLKFRRSNSWSFGVVLNWAYKPLVAYSTAGSGDKTIVAQQWFTHLGASWYVANRLRFNLSLPVLIAQDGSPVLVGTTAFAPSGGPRLGDIRLGVDFRVLGDAAKGIEWAVGARLFAPTGSKKAMSGDQTVRAEFRTLLAGALSLFRYAGGLGFHLRPRDADVAGLPFGNELTWNAALGVSLAQDRVLIGPEVWGASVLTDQEIKTSNGQRTPVEGIVGVHYTPHPSWKIALGAGPGFTRAIGTPKMRALLAIEFSPVPRAKPTAPPPPPPPDRDRDGILDAQDACIDQPGIAQPDHPQEHGCPPKPDRDGDGFDDTQDQCPDVVGVAASAQNLIGCPLPVDQDGDAIPDPNDACPTQAGATNEDPAKHGCPPPPDADGDGIFDDSDACLNVAGIASAQHELHGCPAPTLAEIQDRGLHDISFETNKAILTAESEQALNLVLRYLEANPQVTKLLVEGHTDAQGGKKHNLKLSQARAQAVVDWLVGRGVASTRLEAKGYGSTQPRASNKTAEGRQQNRRVEFHVTQSATLTGDQP